MQRLGYQPMLLGEYFGPKAKKGPPVAREALL
jgi:hypothetical protein